MIERDEQRGEMHIFPLLVKSIHIFSPIDSNIQNCNKKGLKFFACGAHPHIIINFIWGKDINQEGAGGQKYEFKI